MDATHRQYAYRCLPLNIANAHGWEILSPIRLRARWNGASNKQAITIWTPLGPSLVTSHFGNGVLTFHVPCIFRTDPGIDLFVTGPLNRPKDGLVALTGVIETDWAPYTFTMNWQFTRPGLTQFERGEPFCHIFPIERGSLERVEPQLRLLSDDLEIKHEHELWSAGRKSFNAELLRPDSQAASERWQKNYYRGLLPSGEEPPPPSPPPPPPPPPPSPSSSPPPPPPPAGPSHKIKLRLRPFT